MSRKALVIAPQPFFSPRGTPFSVYYRTLVMSELGVECDLLTYGQGQDVDIPGVRIVRIPDFAFLGPVKTGPSAVKAFLDIFVLLWTVGMLIRHRYDIVHAHEESVFFSRFLKPIFRFKLIYDMHSSLPQQLDNFQFTKSRALRAVFKYLEDSSLKAADAVITICPDLANYVESELGKTPKHFLIENSIFEPVRLADAPADSAEPELPVTLPPGARIVIYAGTFEKYQGLDLLIPAFADVVAAAPDAVLLLVGGDDGQVAAMRALAERSGAGDKILFTGRVPQQVARAYNSRADVLTSPRSAGTNTPLKIYEQLASGKPLVATRIHSHTQVLTDDEAFLVEPDPAGLASGIIEALTRPEEAARKVAASRHLYDKAYSRSAYVTKLGKLLELLD